MLVVVDANYETSSSFKCNMDNSKELKDYERIAKQIAKTSDSIRKKYHALKTKIKEDITLEKHFKPIVVSLKQMSKILMRNLNRLRKKLMLRRIEILRKENQKKMKKMMMNMIMVMMMMAIVSGWIIYDFN